MVTADRRTPSTIAIDQPSAIADVRHLMWRSAGLFRTRERLEPAVATLEAAAACLPPSSTTAAWRHRNLLTVARLVARAALRREESRGGHYRADFPKRDDVHWRVHFVDSKN